MCAQELVTIAHALDEGWHTRAAGGGGSRLDRLVAGGPYTPCTPAG